MAVPKERESEAPPTAAGHGVDTVERSASRASYPARPGAERTHGASDDGAARVSGASAGRAAAPSATGVSDSTAPGAKGTDAARVSGASAARAAEPAPTAIDSVDLGAQHAPLRAELQEAFDRVLASGQFILGPEVSAFEAEVARYLSVPHALGVSSGTDALLLALMALGIGPGDEVIVPAFSFFATAGCVSRLGARPVFVDIDLATYNLDPSQLAPKLTAATRAIIPVHLYGLPCELAALRTLAAERGIYLVEDAAQALGAGAVGTGSDFACFSFFPTKNLGALGDAGLVTTHDAALAQRARLLRAHGAEPKYHHALIGGNFRLDALQAAFLRVKLPHLPRWTETRRRHAARYDRVFTDAALPPERLALPTARPGHVYHQYVIRTPQRDALRAHLREQHIASEVYYPVPLHLQACFAALGERPGNHPCAERAAREALALPIHAELSDAQIERIAAITCDFLHRTV